MGTFKFLDESFRDHFPCGREITRMRVGVLSLMHESNTFADGLTTWADFERGILATVELKSLVFIGLATNPLSLSLSLSLALVS